MSAQTFTTIYNFNGTTDGSYPDAELILSGDVCYGTTWDDGLGGNGTVFKLKTDGTGFTTLHSFTANPYPGFTNSDGANLSTGVILSDGTLYGTTYYGGSGANGTLFKVDTNGNGFAVLHSFTETSGFFQPNYDGAGGPGFILSGDTLYGTAYRGGSSARGTIFKLNTNGTSFTTLYNFSGVVDGINSDGTGPYPTLILSGDTLYGTASDGGSSGNGTVFRINIDGTGFTNLHSFSALSDSDPYGNSDGASPWTGLILSGDRLYGTAILGGSFGNGVLFFIKTDGTEFATLHSFSATVGTLSTNSDGVNPYGNLILSGNTLYGTAPYAGPFGNGTVFALNTDGTGFTTLHSFTMTSSGSPYTNYDGISPTAALTLSGNTLYGTAEGGGSFGKGTIFSISLPASTPQLTIIREGANVILSWPTNNLGLILQCATNFVSPIAWSNVSTGVVVNGRNMVTNTGSDSQRFYRLSR